MLLLVSEKEKNMTSISFVQCIIKRLLDLVFVISRIIKVKVRIISRSLWLQLITLTETLIILGITKTELNLIIVLLCTERKNRSNVFCFFIDGRQRKARDYTWPWVFLTWLFHNLQLWRHRRWFQKSPVRFRPIRKELESSMYSNQWYTTRKRCITSIYHQVAPR